MVKLTDEEDRVRLRSYCSDHSYFLGGPLKWLVPAFSDASLRLSFFPRPKICTAESRAMAGAQEPRLPSNVRLHEIRENTGGSAPRHINYNAGNVQPQRYIPFLSDDISSSFFANYQTPRCDPIRATERITTWGFRVLDVFNAICETICGGRRNRINRPCAGERYCTGNTRNSVFIGDIPNSRLSSSEKLSNSTDNLAIRRSHENGTYLWRRLLDFNNLWTFTYLKTFYIEMTFKWYTVLNI